MRINIQKCLNYKNKAINKKTKILIIINLLKKFLELATFLILNIRKIVQWLFEIKLQS
jgi:hypothetical protein